MGTGGITQNCRKCVSVRLFWGHRGWIDFFVHKFSHLQIGDNDNTCLIRLLQSEFIFKTLAGKSSILGSFYYYSYYWHTSFNLLGAIVLHRCCAFYKLKARPSTSKKIRNRFIAILALSRWSGPQPTIPPRYVCALRRSLAEHVL